MTSDPVFDKLEALLAKILGRIAPVTLDAKLFEDYDANSMVDLADHAEEVFKIEFPTEDLKTMTTVADLLNYIRAKLHAKGDAAPAPQA